MLPDFIGIGVNKAGSTWIHDLLSSHPRVWVPEKRKEVRFFTQNYDRGLEWYQSFFPPDDHATRYDAVGEITPHYLYTDGTAERIAALDSVDRLILSLRDPVERLYSSYWFRVRVSGFRGSFEEFMRDRPNEIERGLYASHLSNYLRYFSREQILILVFEKMTKNVGETRSTLADFLGFDADLFPADAGLEKSNVRYVPRLPTAYQKAYRVGRTLRSQNHDWMVNTAKKIGLPRLFGRKSSTANREMNPDSRETLARFYAEDILQLEAEFGVNCSAWRNHPSLQ